MRFLSFLIEPYYYSMCLYILGTVSLPIHIFGAYVILFHTPDTMNRVKWVMFNLHFWSCSLDILLGILGQPFVIPPVFGGASLGILHHFNVNPGIMVYLMVTLIELAGISIGAIFENRFFILFAEDTWWRYARYPYHFLGIVMAITYFIPTMMGVPDQEVARKWIFENYPAIRQYENWDHQIYVVAYEAKARENIGYRMIFDSAALCVILFLFFILLRWNMRKATKNMTMSPKTFEAHRAFLRAINMQIAIPALVMSTPQFVIMVLGSLDIPSPEMNSLAYMIMSIHGSSQSLVMLYWHVPYRQYCQKLFCGDSKKLKFFRASKSVFSTT